MMISGEVGGIGKAVRVLTAVLILCGVAGEAIGQVSAGGSPPSREWSAASTVSTVAMPAIQVEDYLAEDEAAAKDEPYRFGAPFEVNLNLDNSGTWTTLADGSRIWRLRIESEGAYSINLIYDEFFMPEGGRLFVYNDDYRYVIGAFTDNNNKEDGTFATQPVPGDAITLEYQEPDAVRGQGRISVMRVIHAYRNLFGYPDPLDDYGDSGWCNNNVNCPEGQPWQSEKRGVTMILTSGGWRICTGSLINNTAWDTTPLYLTANHCLGGQSAWIFMFNYESPGCSNQNGPTNQTVSGSTLLFNRNQSDVALLQLSAPVPLSYNPYFNGWNAVDEPAESSVAIHHPSGDIKKISFDDDAPVSSGYFEAGSSHWKILTWEDGTTEGGSSGSPLFDENHRITGQLHGGLANCDNNIDDYYGKLALSFTLGLADYLDPAETGAVVLNGFDPNVAGRVTGFIIDAFTCLPLADVTVEVIGGDQSTTSDAQGEYFLPLPDGTFDIEFSRSDYIPHVETGVVITEGDTVDLNVAMTSLPTGTLSGTIRAGASAPIEGAAVSLPGTPHAPVTSNADGRFSFEVPGDRDYDVEISFCDLEFDTSVTVPVAAVVDIDVYLISDRSQSEGPDLHGYYAYDRLDDGIHAEFDWVEIAQRRGGPGTVVPTINPDAIRSVQIPIPFLFYGEEADTLTISENGWVSPGIENNAYSLNGPIPNLSGPRGTIAVYWDNLHGGDSAEIAYWHDAENCRFIIEYLNMEILPDRDSLLTCQIQLFSPEAYPTPSGDSEILFLYERVDRHGSETIGIENQSETVGLQLVFNTNVSEYTWPEMSGSAILLTSRTEPRVIGGLQGTVTAHPAIADYSGAQILISCLPVHPSPTGAYSIPELIGGDRVARIVLEGYEELALEVTINEGETATLDFDVWRLDPPRNLRAESDGGAMVLRWDPPESVGTLDAFEAYAVYVDDSPLATLEGTEFVIAGVEQGMHQFHVTAQYEGGESVPSNSVDVDVPSPADNRHSLPTQFQLMPAYPNPFNATTTLEFALPTPSRVSLVAYDVLGREAARLIHRDLAAGYHRINWRAEDLPSGLYVVRMDAGSFSAVQKLLLLK